MQFLCILLALMMVATPARARPRFFTAEEIAQSFPPEMMYKGHPIDPACVEASNPTEGATVPQDLKTCAHPPEGMTAPNGLQGSINRSLSYTYECDSDGKKEVCGYVSYRYLGKASDGFALETLSNGGGTGQFSSIVVLKRDGDIITTDLIYTGDRCYGGIVAATVKDGEIEYGYNATLSSLYADYKTNGSFQPGNSSPLDCTAVIRKKGDTITSIDLSRTEEQLQNDLNCFADPYRAQIKSGKSLSEDQVKKFFVRVEEKCAQEE